VILPAAARRGKPGIGGKIAGAKVEEKSCRSKMHFLAVI
jgi:hypothetical protein